MIDDSVDKPEQEETAPLVNVEEEIEQFWAKLPPPQPDSADLPADIAYLWLLWADFHLYVVEPLIPRIEIPIIIEPEFDQITKTNEFVYPIYDWGNSFSTSRGVDLAKGLRSTGKLFNTIDKIVWQVLKRVEKMTEESGGKEEGAETPEIRVAIYGPDPCRHKALATILNLPQNMLVVNCGPGKWGDYYLHTIKKLSELGYGLPEDLNVKYARKPRK